MSNTLSIATSGMIALQKAVATTSNNIANVNTEGYSRQRVEFSPQQAQKTGSGFIGKGVRTSGIDRIYNQYLVRQVQDYTASSSRLEAYSDLTARLDNVLADQNNSLSQNVQKFFSALHSLANNPAAIPERRVVMAEGEALATQVRFLDTSLDQFRSEINDRLQSLTGEINTLGSNIAELNNRIAVVSNPSANQIPNDLLDQRDLLLGELSTKIGIKVVEEAGGTVNVFFGTGQPLVVGSNSSEIGVNTSVYDASRFEIVYKGAGGNNSVITDSIRGGEIAGLLDFRGSVLDEARNRLGLLTVGLSETINTQHRQGLDLNGNFGADFYRAASVRVTDNTANLGAATVSATINDVSQLEASDYVARYDGAQWLVIRQSDKAVTTTPGNTTIDGLDFNFGGGVPQNGDSFLIQATSQAASEFGVEIRTPGAIAAASALRAREGNSNLGTGELIELDALNTSALGGDVTLTFNPDALGVGVPGFDVAGAVSGTIAFDPSAEAAGKAVTIAGVADFTLAGVPTAGDSFVISNNSGATGDNRNALKLTDLQSTRLLENGQATYQAYYGNIVADVGVSTRQAEVNASTEASLLSQAKSTRDSVSGVNLEEEAANLLRYQQAYQAAAQIIGVTESMFQTLLRATAF